MAKTTTGSKGNAVAHSECKNIKSPKRQRHCLEHAVRGHSRVPNTFYAAYAVQLVLRCTMHRSSTSYPRRRHLPAMPWSVGHLRRPMPARPHSQKWRYSLTAGHLRQKRRPWRHGHIPTTVSHGATAATVSISKHMCRMRRPVPHPLHMQAGANVQMYKGETQTAQLTG